MNHAHEALKKKLYELKGGGSSKVEDGDEEKFPGEIDGHQEVDEEEGDEIAGPAPHLKNAPEKENELRAEEDIPDEEQEDIGHNDERVAAEDDHVPERKEELSSELAPEEHLKILQGLAPERQHQGREAMSLAERAGDKIREKMKAIKSGLRKS